jgi:1-acyl-sn-glycerol-3-phosphate acyltransferase
VPVAIVGSEKTRNWKRGQFPKVSVRFGAPVRFDKLDEAPTKDQSQYASEQVFERIRGLWQDAKASGR